MADSLTPQQEMASLGALIRDLNSNIVMLIDELVELRKAVATLTENLPEK